jgi:hypothetical protein
MPETIALTESAVAVLRFRLKGLRMPVTDSRRPAFEELAAAGLLGPQGEGYRILDRPTAAEVLREQEDRIERDRYDPPPVDLALSSETASLLSRLAVRERLAVTDENRHLFRELQSARIVMLGSSFATGPESVCRFTYWGWHRRHELTGMVSGPSPAESAAPRP